MNDAEQRARKNGMIDGVLCSIIGFIILVVLWNVGKATHNQYEDMLLEEQVQNQKIDEALRFQRKTYMIVDDKTGEVKTYMYKE